MKTRVLPTILLLSTAPLGLSAIAEQHMAADTGAAQQAYPAGPQYQAPQYQAPQYRAPQYQAPRYQAPQYQAPRYQAPQQYNPYARPYAPRPPMQAPSYGHQYGPAMPRMPAYAPGIRQGAPLNQPQAQPAPASDVNADVPATGDVTVTIKQMQFNPPRIVVKKGSTVNWQQADRMPHDVKARDKSFASPRMRQGDSFSQTFDEPGTYDYYCSLHPRMRGQVVVVE